MSRGDRPRRVARRGNAAGVDRRRRGRPGRAGRTRRTLAAARRSRRCRVEQLAGERRRQRRRLAGGDRDVPGVHGGVERARARADRWPAARPAAPAPLPASASGGDGRPGARGGGHRLLGDRRGSPSSRPDGWNGSSLGHGPSVIVAAKPTWSPAACCNTWVTFHSAHGVGRSQAPAGTPATADRSAACASSMTLQLGHAASAPRSAH